MRAFSEDVDVNFFWRALLRFIPSIILLVGGSWLGVSWYLAEASLLEFEVTSEVLGVGVLDKWRPGLLFLSCLLPSFVALVHALSDVQDRFVGQHFLKVFGAISLVLFFVWILLDLQNRLTDFGDNPEFGQIFAYYVTMSASFSAELMPYCVLLGAIMTFSSLSKHKEIVSLVQSGRSLLRVARNVLIYAGVLVLVVLLSNYHWGPVANQAAEVYLEKEEDEASRELDAKHEVGLTQVFSISGKRLWLFETVKENAGELKKVRVVEYNDENIPIYRWDAVRAEWLGDQEQGLNGLWRLHGVNHYAVKEGARVPIQKKDVLEVVWEETPQQLVLPDLNPRQMGMAQLSKWLVVNDMATREERAVYETQFLSRFAEAFLIILYALIAIPMGCYFDRRSSSYAVLMALVLLFVVEVVDSFVGAAGESARVAAFYGAWATNGFVALAVCYLWIRNLMGLSLLDWCRYHKQRIVLAKAKS